MEIKNYLGRWFYLDTIYWKDSFQEIDNTHWIHPDDSDIGKLGEHRLCKCLFVYGDYLKVITSDLQFRIKVNAIKHLLPTSPKFEWGMGVQEIERVEVVGVVYDIVYHFKDEDYLFYIMINGKKKTRQYRTAELRLIT